MGKPAVARIPCHHVEAGVEFTETVSKGCSPELYLDHVAKTGLCLGLGFEAGCLFECFSAARGLAKEEVRHLGGPLL